MMTVYALVFVFTIGSGSFSETLALYSTERACLDAGYFLSPQMMKAKLECRQIPVRDGTELPRREMDP